MNIWLTAKQGIINSKFRLLLIFVIFMIHSFIFNPKFDSIRIETLLFYLSHFHISDSCNIDWLRHFLTGGGFIDMLVHLFRVKISPSQLRQALQLLFTLWRLPRACYSYSWPSGWQYLELIKELNEIIRREQSSRHLNFPILLIDALRLSFLSYSLQMKFFSI